MGNNGKDPILLKQTTCCQVQLGGGPLLDRFKNFRFGRFDPQKYVLDACLLVEVKNIGVAYNVGCPYGCKEVDLKFARCQLLEKALPRCFVRSRVLIRQAYKADIVSTVEPFDFIDNL